jgi:hypothetical protein
LNEPNKTRETWRAISVYEVIEPIEQLAQEVSSVLSTAKGHSGYAVPCANPRWTEDEQSKVAHHFFTEQNGFVRKFFEDEIQKVTSLLNHVGAFIETDFAYVDEQGMKEFVLADKQGRSDIVDQRWAEATDTSDVRIYEKSWQLSKMRAIMTLTRLHLTQSVPDMISNVEKVIAKLEKDIELDLLKAAE